MARQILIRRGVSTQWTSVNPLLASGEMGLETDTNLFKFGTGLANWVDLPYANIKDHGNLAGLSDDDHTRYSDVTSGSGSPASTPSRVGNIYIDTTADVAYISVGIASSSDWELVNPVMSVNGHVGVVVLTKSDVGLGNVDNTSDLDKPISTATQTAISNHLNDTVDAHLGSAIGNTPSGNLVATTVQAALNELQTDVDTRALNSDFANHINDTIDAHAASAITNTPSGNIVATTVQAAINELQSDIDTRALNSDLTNHLNDTVDAHMASAIGNTPSGNVSSTTVQAAINELQGDVDTINALKGTACFSGCLTEPSYTDNGGGNVTINTVDVSLFSNANFDGITSKHTLAAITVDLVDGARNYIVADYNSGSPILRLTTNVGEITESSIIPVYTILRVGSYLNFLGWDTLGRGLANKLHQATVKTDRYKFESAWAISEYGTRNLNINMNNIYVGGNKIVASAIATSTDTIRYFLRTGPSAWTYTSVTQYNNTEYFNGTTTATLGNNKYAVNWLYRGAEITPHLYMVLGEGDYNLQEAQASQPPSELPFTITGHAFLIGRVIVQKGASTAAQINSVSQVTFTPSATTNHEDLAGLLGGTASEHYHLTSAQHVLATQNASTSQTGLLSSTDWTTFNAKQNDLSAITKEITGFVTPTAVTVSYDSTTRVITLSGTLTAYWRGQPVTITPVSLPHDITESVTYFYYYDGSSLVWSTTHWTFDILQIAIVVFYPTHKYCLKETHGMMNWQTHKEFHETIGTYLSAGGDLSSFVLASTTAANRRPDISAATVNDEDLTVVNPSLTSKLYSTFALTGTTPTALITTGYAEIVPVSTNQPYYNQNNGGTWQQTLMQNNAYQAIFLIAIPVSSDSKSQSFRYVWVQGQTQSTTLSVIQGIIPNDLNLNGLTVSSPEFVFIAKIIIRYTGGNWQLISTQKLTGNRFTQVGSPAGAYLSSVTTDATLTGSGTALDPLSVPTLLGTTNYIPKFNGTTGLSQSIVYDTGTNVGIGTTAPTSKLHIKGTTSDNTTSSLNITNSVDASLLNVRNNGNVGIGTTTPNTTAILDITSTTKGVLLPRLTTTEVQAITSPATGLTVYNTTENTLCFYNGTSWQKVTSSAL